MTDNFKIFKDGDKIIAIVIKNNFKKEGMTFFTGEDSSQQLASIYYKKGKNIKPHVHIGKKRDVFYTQEILFIKRGKIKLDLYSRDKQLLETVVLGGGDVILLSLAGHGYEVLQDVEIVLVKQGPYIGEEDKTYV